MLAVTDSLVLQVQVEGGFEISLDFAFVSLLEEVEEETCGVGVVTLSASS